MHNHTIFRCDGKTGELLYNYEQWTFDYYRWWMAENAPALRKVIAQNGNHVDAWFISHTHSDHVGAFNVIYADPQGMTIDRIYDNGYDYEFIKEVGEPYDSMGLEPLETFHNLTKDADNIIHLRRDEELEVCGLRVHVYNAFDDIVKQNVGQDLDYQNDGSLCMKITNQDESFCIQVMSRQT